MFEAVTQNDTVVGTGVGGERNNRFYVWGLYILPTFQRMGVGTKIMTALCNSAPPNSFLEVQVLRESNKAQQFYKRFGFVTFHSSAEEVFPNVNLMTDFMGCSVTSLRETLLV